MIDQFLRPLKERLLRPVVMLLGDRVHPEVLSFIGLLVGTASALWAAFGWFAAALVFWIVNRIIDGLDGAVARARQVQSDRGGYLDIIFDFIVYASVPIAIALNANEVLYWSSVSLLLGAYYLNSASWMYLSALLEKRTHIAAQSDRRLELPTSIVMPRGIIEGGETIVFYVLFLLFPLQFPLLAFGMAGLTLLGALLRVIGGLRMLGDLDVLL